MDHETYVKLKAEIIQRHKDERDAELEVLDTLARLSGNGQLTTARDPQTERRRRGKCLGFAKAIREAVDEMPNEFTTVDVGNWVKEHVPALDLPELASNVSAQLAVLRQKAALRRLKRGNGPTGPANYEKCS